MTKRAYRRPLVPIVFSAVALAGAYLLLAY
jgi:hypothetical protein